MGIKPLTLTEVCLAQSSCDARTNVPVVFSGCDHGLSDELLEVEGQQGEVSQDTDTHTVLLQLIPTHARTHTDKNNRIPVQF